MKLTDIWAALRMTLGHRTGKSGSYTRKGPGRFHLQPKNKKKEKKYVA